ncbi:hypothetical protein Ddc_17210 [Ditylenchus destructor]|nr:hypothetical protein Ddc_17210 [Ditylenchus destructor]
MKWALALLLSNSLGFWGELGSALAVAIPNGLVSILTGAGKMIFGASTTPQYSQATGFPRCNCCGRVKYGVCEVSRVCIACCTCKHCEWIAINQGARGN